MQYDGLCMSVRVGAATATGAQEHAMSIQFGVSSSEMGGWRCERGDEDYTDDEVARTLGGRSNQSVTSGNRRLDKRDVRAAVAPHVDQCRPWVDRAERSRKDPPVRWMRPTCARS